MEITAAKPSCTTCLRSAARLNTTLPGGLEMVSVFAAQVETTKKTRHSCPTYKQWRTKVANVLMRFRLFEAVVHAPHLIHFARSSLQHDMRSMYDGLEKVADLRLKGTNLGWVPEPHPIPSHFFSPDHPPWFPGKSKVWKIGPA